MNLLFLQPPRAETPQELPGERGDTRARSGTLRDAHHQPHACSGWGGVVLGNTSWEPGIPGSSFLYGAPTGLWAHRGSERCLFHWSLATPGTLQQFGGGLHKVAPSQKEKNTKIPFIQTAQSRAGCYTQQPLHLPVKTKLELKN